MIFDVNYLKKKVSKKKNYTYIFIHLIVLILMD